MRDDASRTFPCEWGKIVHARMKIELKENSKHLDVTMVKKSHFEAANGPEEANFFCSNFVHI